MKILRNVGGYSLLTVLLMITVFTIICLAFIGYSYTTSKQSVTVENQTKSVAFAEMGISFVEAAINDIYQSNKDEIDDEILAEMENDLSNTDYTDLALEKMNDRLQTGLEMLFNLEENTFENNTIPDPIFVKNINSDETNPNIQIRDFKIVKNSDENNITLSFVSEGKDVKGDAVPLRANMVINITPNEEDEGGIHVGIGLPTFNSIPEPSASDCGFPKDCNSLLIKPILGIINPIITINLNKLIDKTIYSTENLIFNANLNSSENLKLHAIEEIIISDNMNNANNLLLETLSDLTLNGNTDFIGNSILYVGNNMTNNKHLNITGKTVALIEGNLNIKDKFDLASQAKMCVKGNVNIDNLEYITIDSDIGLIVKNKVFVNGSQYTEQISGIKTSPKDWEELCECQIPYSWDENVSNNVEYQY